MAKAARGVILMVLFALANAASNAGAATYYVANDGSDENDGLAPERAWRTIAMVNRAELKPGDSVLLKRGDRWREALIPHSGSEEGYVTYGAYGEGDKPLLLGSVAKSRPEDWHDEGNNIWSTAGPDRAIRDLLPEGATDSLVWHLHYEGGAQASGARDDRDFDSPPASYRVECTKPGESGSHIQLYLAPFSIEQGKLLRLTFRAKCTEPIKLTMPRLMMAGTPWTAYAGPSVGACEVGADWVTCTQHYQTTVSADDARLTLYLGTALPEGAVLHIDSLSLAECEGGEWLPADVGNIIFDNEASCGVKVWNEADLQAQGQYWYDEDRHGVKLYSESNPGEFYSAIECALRIHMINQSSRSYVTYENLALKYGGAHGIGGGSTAHIIVRDCDFGFIGGGDQHGGDRTVRFGNGVEFWGNAHDCLVQRCRLWEIYDAALTNQNSGPNVKQYNITYRNNVIWNSEYSFEYWNRPENSETYNIRFEHNTCVNAGHGWGHTQRRDPSGRHLCFYTSPAAARDMFIRNNIFFEAATNAFFAPQWAEEGLAALHMDNNLWHQAEDVMVLLKDHPYTMAQFAQYQAEQGMEEHSILGDPLFVDAAHLDFRLSEASPCVDAGMDVGVEADFEGTPRPQGAAPDIGAYELPQ
jgi:hypothetical protein